MNLRVLIYLNPLVVDKIAKKFLYEKDSGFLYTKQLIEGSPNNWRFTVLVPKKFDPTFFNHPNIEYVEYDYSTSIHQNRYHFNRNIIAKAYPYTKDVDLIINNQPEVTANLKVLFQNQRRENPPIINVFHWIDCKESAQYGSNLSGFYWRQIEAYNMAELSLFHNPYAYNLFSNMASQHNITINHNKHNYFKPMATKFGTEKCDAVDLWAGKKIILFNQRLNNTTGWKEILKECTLLRQRRTDFVLWFTDQNLKHKKELQEIDWIVNFHLPFKSYGYLLEKAHFSICNTTGYATWNMAVLDSLYNNCLALVPNTQLYKDVGGKRIDKDNLLDWMDTLLNLESTEINSMIRLPHQEDFKYQEFIETYIKNKVENKVVGKYDKVKELIQSKPTTKKDFVNKFWSFHANSNFQLIRWKLLSEGFHDDTTNEYSHYFPF